MEFIGFLGCRVQGLPGLGFRIRRPAHEFKPSGNPEASSRPDALSSVLATVPPDEGLNGSLLNLRLCCIFKFGPDEYILDIPGLTAQDNFTTPWYDILTAATRYGRHRHKRIELRKPFQGFGSRGGFWAHKAGDSEMQHFCAKPEVWSPSEDHPDMDAVRIKSIEL